MPAIETLLLANHVDAVNGLINLLGGGWTDIQMPPSIPGQAPATNHFGIAITIDVGWADTNRTHQLRVWIEHEDGGDPLLDVQAAFEHGRPPGLTPGSDLRAPIAINADIAFPRPGGYRLAAQIGENLRTVSFRVRQLGQQPAAA